MGTDDPRRRLRENATAVVSTLVTGIWLAAMLADLQWWLPFMLFGYVVLVPLTEVLFGEDEGEQGTDRADEVAESDRDGSARESPADDRALDRLRERYAAGELTDEQFERKVERLLETETLEDVEDRHRESARTHASADGTRESEDDGRESESAT